MKMAKYGNRQSNNDKRIGVTYQCGGETAASICSINKMAGIINSQQPAYGVIIAYVKMKTISENVM